MFAKRIINKIKHKMKVPKKGLKKSFNLLDSISDSLLIFDRNLKLVEINKAALKVFNAMGLHRKGLIGKHILELAPRPYSKEVLFRYRKYKEVLKTGRPFIAEEPFIRPSFKDRYALLRAFRVADGLGILGTDITERKGKEALLKESEAKYRELTESIADIIFALDVKGKIIFVNQAIKQLGWHPEEIIGTSLYNWVPKNRLKAAKDLFRQIVNGKKIRGETYILDKQGKERNIEFSASAVMKDGRAIGSRGIIRDITARKKAEALAEENRIRLENFMDSATENFVILSPDLNFLDINKTNLKRWGIRKEDVLGKNISELGLKIQDVIKYKKHLLEVLKSRKPLLIKDTVFHPRYKEKRHVELKIFKVGENLGLISEDITAHLAAERRLKQSEQEFRLIFENAKDAIFWADPRTGLIINCNKAAELLLEKRKSQIIGHRQAELHPPKKAKEYIEMFKRHIKHKGTVDDEAEIIASSGKIKPVHITASVTKIGDRPIIQGIFRDITERKKTEEALRVSEQRFREIATQLPVVVFQSVAKKDGTRFYTFLSEGSHRLFGNRPEELYRDYSLAFRGVAGQDRQKLSKLISESIRTLKPWQTEFQMKSKWAEIKWLHAISSPHQLADGSIVFNGIVIDITERKQAEEKLARISKAVESASDAIGMSDPQGRHFYQNQAFTKLFGYATAQKLQDVGGGPAAYVDKNVARQVFSNIMSGKPWSGAVNMISKDGRRFWVFLRADAIKDEAGRTIGLIGVHTDITERKQAEEALARSEKSFRQLVESAGSVILCISSDYRILEFNQEAEKLYGRKRQAVLGKNYLKLFVPQKERQIVAGDIKEVLTGKLTRGFKNTVVTGSGQSKIFSWNVNPLPEIDRKIPGIIAVGHDITEQKRSEEAKANLIRNISHGLKAPIAVSKMASDVLEQGIKENNIQLIKKAHSISSGNINKLQKDVKNILEVFSLKERRAEKRKKVSLKKIINKGIINLGYLLNNKKIKIKIDIPQGAENICIVPRDLGVVLDNILDNAVKFTDRGYIYIKSRRRGAFVQITVKDTGCGIAPMGRDRLFEQFYKQHPALPGTGLGLSICKEIVQMYNGNIDVISAGEGKGTTVIVRLPLK